MHPKLRRTRDLLAVVLFVLMGSSFALSAVLAIDVTITATVVQGVDATVQWAVPEGRVGAPGTNDDTDFYLTVRDPGTHAILSTVPTSSLLTTSTDGTFLTPTEINVAPGTYDIGFKGHQSLTRILRSVPIVSGTNVLNFTQPDNSAPKGIQVLLAGDVNGAGTSPATLGDDVVNSVDISTLLTDIDQDDPSGNALRPNLNQDVVVNSVDLSLMIGNLDKEGDK